MLMKILPASYGRYVDHEMERVHFEINQDTFERKQEIHRVPDIRLVPNDFYDAHIKGEVVVLTVSPNDPLPDVIKRVTEALLEARRVMVTAA